MKEQQARLEWANPTEEVREGNLEGTVRLERWCKHFRIYHLDGTQDVSGHAILLFVIHLYVFFVEMSSSDVKA
jgi:hypothetical protein